MNEDNEAIGYAVSYTTRTKTVSRVCDALAGTWYESTASQAFKVEDIVRDLRHGRTKASKIISLGVFSMILPQGAPRISHAVDTVWV